MVFPYLTLGMTPLYRCMYYSYFLDYCRQKLFLDSSWKFRHLFYFRPQGQSAADKYFYPDLDENGPKTQWSDCCQQRPLKHQRWHPKFAVDDTFGALFLFLIHLLHQTIQLLTSIMSNSEMSVFSPNSRACFH